MNKKVVSVIVTSFVILHIAHSESLMSEPWTQAHLHHEQTGIFHDSMDVVYDSTAVSTVSNFSKMGRLYELDFEELTIRKTRY